MNSHTQQSWEVSGALLLVCLLRISRGKRGDCSVVGERDDRREHVSQHKHHQAYSNKATHAVISLPAVSISVWCRV